jgi:hydrogenase maturation protease
MTKSAIIGVGNLLMGDEGIGVHAVEYLRKAACHSRRNDKLTGIDILDGGTGGMTLFHLFERYERVIIIDAADFGGKPGEVRSFAMKDLRLAPDSAQVSLHGTSLAGILELANKLGKKMPEITIVAVQPKTIAPSLKLSDECEKILPEIFENIHSLLTDC